MKSHDEKFLLDECEVKTNLIGINEIKSKQIELNGPADSGQFQRQFCFAFVSMWSQVGVGAISQSRLSNWIGISFFVSVGLFLCATLSQNERPITLDKNPQTKRYQKHFFR